MAHVDGALDEIVARAMAREVTNQYSAADLKADLEAWLEGRRPGVVFAGPRAAKHDPPSPGESHR